jgi:hypothetical protein
MAFPATAGLGPAKRPRRSADRNVRLSLRFAIVSEGVLKRFTLVMVAICAVGIFSGCQRSSVISIPPGAPNKLYVNDNINGVIAYTMPLGPASAPAFTLAGTSLNGSGMATGPSGSVFAAHFGAATIDVFNQPITSASTPAFTIQLAASLGPTVKLPNASGMSFDPAGNLWIAGELGDQVYMLAPPFAAGPVVPKFFNSTSFSGPVMPLFDRAGELIVAEFGGSQLLVFRAPFNFGANNVPVATITLPTALGSIGISQADQLVVGLNDGTVAFFNGPFATGNVPAFVIPAPAGSAGVRNAIFDSSNNLYVPYASSSQIGVFAPPYSGVSVPMFEFTTGLSFPYGLTLAP